MQLRRRFSNLRFASKILLLVGLMGLVSVGITAYALANMQIVNHQYRNLIAQEAQAALTIADAARHLDGASRLAYTVLTEPDEVRMLALLGELQAYKGQFDYQFRNLGALLPSHAAQVERITTESQQIFESAGRIITAASRWRGDRALQIIHSEFEPALQLVRSEMDGLRNRAVSRFKIASAELSQRTAQTVLVTALAIGGALLLVIPLALYVAIAHMSRPLVQLTRTMERMSQRHYHDHIALTERADEVGQMASALRVFQRSMQREDQLANELAASAEALRLSEQLVDLTDAIPGAVFQMQVSPHGLRRILFASERTAELFERPVAELLQTRAAAHEFEGASNQAIQIAHDAFTRSAHSLEPLDFDTETTRHGKTRWIKTLATARRATDGGAIFNGVWLDVTEQREQAQALLAAKNFAEKMAEDKARFLATMSHEIRTPLNAVLGMTQLAIHHESNDCQRDRLSKSMRAGRHLLNIVNDVLDISKIEAGKMEIELEDFAPREWLAELIELMSAPAHEKGLALHLHIDASTPAQVRGDRQRMGQIVINYLNNAIKFTESGRIDVSIDAAETCAHNTLLRCSVQDTGVGIAEAEQSAIFTAFAQADSSITRSFGGTGLGLAISRQLAQLMGGGAGVTSAKGSGSTFWFTARVALPPANPTAPAALPTAHLTDSAARLPHKRISFGHHVRVLLVDDNELNRAVAHGMLEVTGVTVDEACDGAQALAMLEESDDGTYALVLMDMQMPVMDGLAASRAMRENARFADLPVIALTANASEEDIARTRAAGMDDHLCKPLLADALWLCLNRWLPSSVQGVAPRLPESDLTVLHELTRALGEERAKALVVAFMCDCESRLALMQRIAQLQPVDWNGLAMHAHDLSGSAGSFGLSHLGERAHQLCTRIAEQNEAGARLAFSQLLACARADVPALRSQMEEPR